MRAIRRRNDLMMATWLLIVAPSVVDARVVRLEVERKEPHADGRSFGEHGAFERLEGIVYMEVDPEDLRNSIIVNLDKVSKNANGRVSFSAPFVIVKPVDVMRGNRKILYGINNRGNTIELPWHVFPRPGSIETSEDSGHLFFELGYTFVDAGWAGDIITTETRLGANLPVANETDGAHVASSVRIEYSTEGYTVPLKGNSRFRSYETSDIDPRNSLLTVRDSVDGTRIQISPDRWAFGKCETGRLSLRTTTTDLCLFDGFLPGKFYELTYPARDPWVMGLGYAVTRDLASFLRYETEDDVGNPNPLAAGGATVGIGRAYGFGISSTGMYLRDFLYLGFNADEDGRQVFDAVRILIPGTHRLFANVEFADPNVYSRQDQNHDFMSASYAPFTYAVTTDPISGLRDGILKRPDTDPLVMHIDTANEFWQMNASLNVHDGVGKPVPIPSNVRLYSIANHSHVGASGVGARPTTLGNCAYPINGNSSFTPFLRAMLVALDLWADQGVAPPDSVYPSVRDHSLVTVAQAAELFPDIPGVIHPDVVNELPWFDFGPRFRSTGGVITEFPPVRRGDYRVLVPKPDAEGIDVVGVRTVDVRVPVGTNTGWNLRAPGPRSRDLCGLSGSFFSFFDTRVDRLAAGDSRLSLEERYGDHEGFVDAVRQAVRELTAERFLLTEDAETIIRLAEDSDILR